MNIKLLFLFPNQVSSITQKYVDENESKSCQGKQIIPRIQLLFIIEAFAHNINKVNHAAHQTVIKYFGGHRIL